MRKWPYLLLFLAMVLLPSVCLCQTITVTGFVKDSNGTAYAGGSGVFTLVPQNGNFTYNTNNPVPRIVSISQLSSTGFFSVTLTNTAVIDQQNLNPQWQASFCSAQYSNPTTKYCFTDVPIALTSSQDLTAIITPQAVVLPISGGAGCSVSGNIGDLQLKASPATCGASHINDGGTISGDLTFTEPSVQPQIDNIVLVDGHTYACTSSGITSALAAGTSSQVIVDARGCQGTITWSTPVSIGSTSKVATLLLDKGTKENVTINSGGSCAVSIYGGSSLIVEGGTASVGNTSPIGGFYLANGSHVGSGICIPNQATSNGFMIDGVTFQSNPTLAGSGGPTIDSAVIFLVNPLQIGTLRNSTVGPYANTPLILVTETSSGAVGPINLDNDQADCRGGLSVPATGCQPLLIQGVNGGGVMGDINIIGGLYVHPYAGLPMIDIEGFGASPNNAGGVVATGVWCESSNSTDTCIKANDAHGVLIDHVHLSAAGTAGQCGLTVAGASDGIEVINGDNFNGWTYNVCNSFTGNNYPSSNGVRFNYNYVIGNSTDSSVYEDSNGVQNIIDSHGFTGVVNTTNLTIGPPASGQNDYFSVIGNFNGYYNSSGTTVPVIGNNSSGSSAGTALVFEGASGTPRAAIQVATGSTNQGCFGVVAGGQGDATDQNADQLIQCPTTFTEKANSTFDQNVTIMGTCSGCGGGNSITVNGGATIPSPANFQNGPAFQGLTINALNPSLGNVDFQLAGTATEALLPNTTVFTDQNATFGAHTYDFSGVTLMKGRVGAGLTTSANGDFGYDTTNKNWRVYANASDLLMGVWASAPTNGHCVEAQVSSSVVTLLDAGGTCSTGASTAWSSITNGTNSNAGTFTASGNSWSFTASTIFKLRAGSGLTTSANGDIGYDTTNSNWHFYANGGDEFLAGFASAPTTGDCVKATVVSSVITLADFGAGCGGTPPTLQTNTVNNASQALLNIETSTANSVGLTVTPSNPSGGIEKFEVTGSSYTGNAATATALASAPSTCTAPSFTTGINASGTAQGCNPGGIIIIANAASTGTTAHTLTKLTGAPSTAVIAATTDTGGVVGITISGAGTSSNATIQTSGQPTCVFDGATTAGDYVQISTMTGGDCTDAGSTYPLSGQIVGRVLSTNASAGTYQIDLFDEQQGFRSAPSYSTTGTNGGLTVPEGTGGALTPSTSVDILWGDSTAQRLKMNNHNVGADTVLGAATTDTLTNKTFDSAGTGNVFKINGNQLTAVSGNTVNAATATAAVASASAGTSLCADGNGNVGIVGCSGGGGGGGPAAGSCTMSSATTCTATLSPNLSNPICMTTLNGTSTLLNGECSVNTSTGVVTITANSSNSDVWNIYVTSKNGFASSGGGTWTLVQTAYNNNCAASANCTVTLGSGLTSGNVVTGAAWIPGGTAGVNASDATSGGSTYSYPTGTYPAGCTYQDTSINAFISCFYTLAVSGSGVGSTSIKISSSSLPNNYGVVVAEWHYTGSTPTFDVAGTNDNYNVTQTPQYGPNLTLTGTNDLIFAFGVSQYQPISSVSSPYSTSPLPFITTAPGGTGGSMVGTGAVGQSSGTGPSFTPTGASSAWMSIGLGIKGN